MLRILVVLGALLIGSVEAKASVYSYNYLAGDVVCEVSANDCDALAWITAPGRNGFSINSRLYPVALPGSTLSINVKEFMAQGDLYSVVLSSGSVSFVASGGYSDVVSAIGIFDPRGILAELLSPPVAYSNSATISFGADGGILRWSFGVVTGGSGDYGSSGLNGFGREDAANGAFTEAKGTWSFSVAAVPLPASGLLLAGGLVLFMAMRRRPAIAACVQRARR